MTSRSRSAAIQDFLEGRLSPAARARLRRHLQEDPSLRRELREFALVHALLSVPIDVEPPAELLGGVLAAVRAAPAADPRERILSLRLERVLVVAGAAVLAGLLAAGGRLLELAAPPGWLGKAALTTSSLLTSLAGSAGGAAGALGRLDWAGRLLLTVTGAAEAVVRSTVEVVWAHGPLFVLLLLLGGLAVAGTARRIRGGGAGHVGLLA